MNIGLDFDDVVAYTHPLKAKLAQELFGITIHPDRFRREWIVPLGILTDDEYKEIGRRLFQERHEISPVKDALECIASLRRAGHSIKIVSSRSHSGKSLSPAIEWMRVMSLDLELIGVGYGKSKAPACVGLDLFVDDDDSKLTSLIGIVPHLLHFSWPHTKKNNLPRELTVVFSWREVVRYIHRV